MFGKLTLVSLIAASLVAAQSSLQINSISQARTCIPINIVWTGGQGPYFLQVLQGGSDTEQLVDLGEQTGTSYTWTPNLPAGTSITLGVTDSDGNNAYTAASTITEGPSTSCVGQAAGAGTTTGATGTTATTSSGTRTGSQATSSSSGTRSSETGSSSSRSSSSRSSGAASPSASEDAGASSGAMGLAASLVSVAGVAAAVFLA